MDNDLYRAARKAGCPNREAQALATYVESETVRDVAMKLGIREQTVKNHLLRCRQRLAVVHTSAAVAKLLSLSIVLSDDQFCSKCGSALWVD